jgi:hypothetical protein
MRLSGDRNSLSCNMFEIDATESDVAAMVGLGSAETLRRFE